VSRDAYRVGVEIDLSELAVRLKTEAMRLISELSRQGYSGQDLADRVSAGLMDLSDRPIQDAARGASSESFNLGRNLGAQDSAAEITQVIRTEVLDGNTCPPCARLDGEIRQMNTPEYFADMPPNHCDGRDQCRGFYMYIAGGANA